MQGASQPALSRGAGPRPSCRLLQPSFPLHCQCCPLDGLTPLTIQSDLIISHWISKQNKTETSSRSTTRQALSHFLSPLRRVVSLPHACSPHIATQPPLCCLCCYQEKDLQPSPCWQTQRNTFFLHLPWLSISFQWNGPFPLLRCSITSVKSDFLQPPRLLCPWRFSRQEYWNGSPCPPPGDLPNPGIKSVSPALQVSPEPDGRRAQPDRKNKVGDLWLGAEVGGKGY